MKILTALALTLLLCTGSQSQSEKQQPLLFSHRVALAQPVRTHAPRTSSGHDTIRILAAMVAFQTDADDRTTGNGTFDLSDTLGRVIDPAPHNKNYFAHHLEFLSNYFRKVSDGSVTVVCDLLDNVYTMPHAMPYYSPPRASTTNTELGYLLQDAWHIVDSVTPGALSAQNYDSYILFHAGAGRDIDLTALYGYDPTPLDLPSVYLGLASLQKMFGSSYAGVPVAGGTRHVTNTMIIPETENRLLPSAIGTSLLELSTNGLICASLGSHLGLPDLFDTKTGATGIGRFGLMDGQSIFSWSGIFPPEPSAWEKYYLGWTHPIVVSSGDTIYTLPAVSLAGGTDTVYKVLISEHEYFLVENRNRDANRDGSTVTMMMHDSVFTQTWSRDTIGFNAFNIAKLFGVITDVDEFDWSLPGGVNTSTHEFFDGGTLIWHIDERIIDSTIADDAVNANADRRGVNLMEADGSQDIGQSYGFLEAGSGSENGTPFDYWYAGNRAPLRLRSNAFTPVSHPSSMSNDGANSHITINDFTDRAPRMTVRIQVGDDVAAPAAGFPVPVDTGAGYIPVKVAGLAAGVGDIVVQTGRRNLRRGAVHAWGADGLPLDSLLFASHDALRVGFALNDPRGSSLVDTAFIGRHAGEAMTAPVVTDTLLAVGVADSVFFLGASGGVLGRLPVTAAALSLASAGTVVSVSADSSVALLTKDEISASKKLKHPLHAAAVSGFLSPASPYRIVVATADGYVYALDNSLATTDGFPVATGGTITASPALADLDGDGRRDIIVCSGNRIFALNAGGALLDGFPVTAPTAQPLASSPLVADINADGKPELVTVTREGLVVAYNRSGKMIDGFPLAAGPNAGASPAFILPPTDCLSCTDLGLAVASTDGYLYAWVTGTIRGLAAAPAPPWPQELHDEFNTGLVDSALVVAPPASAFLPKDRAYNWPNPVDRNHGFKTHIRYYVAGDATVKIKIFDLAGDLVTQMDGPGRGGIDNEVEWDVTRIQSGVYFAHIDAQGSAGSGSAVIKVAVIK